MEARGQPSETERHNALERGAKALDAAFRASREAERLPHVEPRVTVAPFKQQRISQSRRPHVHRFERLRRSPETEQRLRLSRAERARASARGNRRCQLSGLAVDNERVKARAEREIEDIRLKWSHGIARGSAPSDAAQSPTSPAVTLASLSADCESAGLDLNELADRMAVVLSQPSDRIRSRLRAYSERRTKKLNGRDLAAAQAVLRDAFAEEAP
jgi:hypothetical protein